MGDFNAHSYDSAMKDFIKVNGLIKLIKGNTYFKGQGYYIDLILTNKMFSLKHKLLRNWYKWPSPFNIFDYRNYKKFSFENLKTSLDNALRHCSTDYKYFEYIFTSVLNENAPTPPSPPPQKKKA